MTALNLTGMRIIKALILLLMLNPGLYGQTGKVFDNLSMSSEILDMERKYAIYLPPDYEISERHYPVLYLLHGATDDHSGWIQFGEVLHIADKTIQQGKATPMIIVMPDADTKRMGYVNSPGKDWRYEDFFFEEFIPFIEKKYRIRSEKRYRAIAGLSMGGGGTFYYAMHQPDMFSSACPLSASTGPLTIEQAKQRLDKTDPGITNKQVEEFYNNYSVLRLIENIPEAQKNSVRWYIDCGDDDFLFEGNSLVHIAMRKKNIPHEFRIRDGAHSWSYWRESLPEVLDFVYMSFHQH